VFYIHEPDYSADLQGIGNILIKCNKYLSVHFTVPHVSESHLDFLGQWLGLL